MLFVTNTQLVIFMDRIMSKVRYVTSQVFNRLPFTLSKEVLEACKSKN